MKVKKLLCAAATALLAGIVGIMATACSGGKEVKIIEIDLTQEQYAIAVAKGNTTLKDQINEILTELTGEGVDVDGQKVTVNSLFAAEMEAMENDDGISIGTVKTASTNRANELVVATNAYFAPFEYFVGDEFGGVDMQIAKIIADELGKELVIKHMEFESVFTSLGDDNDADIAIAGITASPDRAETVDFTNAYYDSTQRIAVLADDDRFADCTTEEDVVEVLKNLTGVTAGAAKAQTGYFYLTGNDGLGFEGFTNINTKMYTTIALAVQDLANGKLQLVCGDKDTLSAAVKAINR